MPASRAASVKEPAVGVVLDENVGPATDKLPTQPTLARWPPVPESSAAAASSDEPHVCKVRSGQFLRGSALASRVRRVRPPRGHAAPAAAISSFLVKPGGGAPDGDCPPDDPLPEDDGDADDEVEVADEWNHENHRGAEKRQGYTAAATLFGSDCHHEAMSTKRAHSETRNPDGAAVGAPAPRAALYAREKLAQLAKIIKEVQKSQGEAVEGSAASFNGLNGSAVQETAQTRRGEAEAGPRDPLESSLQQGNPHFSYHGGPRSFHGSARGASRGHGAGAGRGSGAEMVLRRVVFAGRKDE